MKIVGVIPVHYASSRFPASLDYAGKFVHRTGGAGDTGRWGLL